MVFCLHQRAVDGNSRRFWRGWENSGLPRILSTMPHLLPPLCPRALQPGPPEHLGEGHGRAMCPDAQPGSIIQRIFRSNPAVKTVPPLATARCQYREAGRIDAAAQSLRGMPRAQRELCTHGCDEGPRRGTMQLRRRRRRRRAELPQSVQGQLPDVHRRGGLCAGALVVMQKLGPEQHGLQVRIVAFAIDVNVQDLHGFRLTPCAESSERHVFCRLHRPRGAQRAQQS
mmetsp:Transcript_173987/g.557796  ORF Transcript_173987/g.557796 Transcript_173987/m.557796 type:complete len:228 (-) Transcript_173987:95-778(-)